MPVFFNSLRFLPLYLGMLYLGSLVALFLSGTFEWPENNDGIVLGFLLVTLVAPCVGYSLSGSTNVPCQPQVNWRKCYRLGALLSIGLLFPSTYAYTGKWPWDVMSVLGDQGAAYQEMLKALEASESGIRNYVLLAGALLAPFVCCVIPFAILNWRSLRWLDGLLVLGHVCVILVFFLMLGTDRETDHLLVFTGGSFLVLVGQAIVRHGRFPFSASKVLVSALPMMVLLFSTWVLFIERVIAIVGFIWGSAWKSALLKGSDAGALVFYPDTIDLVYAGK